jgi:NADPH:quinone reductase-like Zn-dependent oxidoreductase
MFSRQGKEWMVTRPNAAKWLQAFAIWAVADKVFRFLGRGVMNNWTNDTYNWSREIVVVTGGSDGIGACVVKLLSERKIKVVVLDIQEPKYTCTFPQAPRGRLTGR